MGMWLYDPNNLPLAIDVEHQNEDDLVIFLLFKTSPEEVEKIQSNIKDATKNTNRNSREVKVIPQEHHSIRSRRDLITLHEKFRGRSIEEDNQPPLYFLLSCPEQNIEIAPFATVSGDQHGLTVISRTSFDVIVEWTHEYLYRETPALLSDTAHEHGLETLMNPGQPFYFDASQWPGDYASQYSEGKEQISVWYLTNKLTPAQDDAIKVELLKPSEMAMEDDSPLVKECCYVPWTGQKDATWEYIWNIMWRMVRSHGGWDTFVCIDQQSAQNLQVVLVDSWYYYHYEELTYEEIRDGKDYCKLLEHLPHPDLRGFMHTRIEPKEAHDEIRAIEVHNTTIPAIPRRIMKKQRRPGWPDLDILPSDNDTEECELYQYY
ncbi:hypothetical protein N7520_002635 [Penicillium odoratum]|uniref:uncharacterized protein n=1 Tax=Penicillium odoratum TaxID=1167516 RepID=UPI0025483405|nr:uncharacterized protein N7520_002635 [Penicillium odoratum]KAJ5772106.1 hypothetical protein N7520_002635 [Penicillium odoratum]